MRVAFFSNQWQSGVVRAKQIAGELEKRAVDTCVDPTVIYPTDVCVFVKCFPPEEIVNRLAGRTIVDVVDGYGLFPWLSQHPTVELVAISTVQAKFLKEMFPGRKIWTIPEHVCNFEHARVIVSTPSVAGYIGCREGLQLDADDLAKTLKPYGITFMALESPMDRFSVCRFYRQIDLQINFRKSAGPYPEFKNPLKLANAGSFGIPTIAYPEPSDVDFGKDSYISVETVDEVVEQCKRLRSDSALYQSYCTRAFIASGPFSINFIVDRWLKVLDGNVDSL